MPLDEIGQGVFPAPAGINRVDGQPGNDGLGVPRASGDKPGGDLPAFILLVCSPRQRG
ncbi:hypothetical protein IOP85_002325 [Salmonella enterica]|nr:hypothetical protein [Salmonella enterica]EGK7219459.1 hypothetical protein [Salmonella enterica subsp. enterica serovar Amager]EGG3066370.1 hypothetical protein [Salmonella enterica]EGK2217714.1 hypothetical protein [Salmonella enterica]EGL7476846.1 hypothetical protein [Salmonella enterica]